MTSKLKTILLLFALLSLTIAHEYGHHKCTHGDKEHPPHEFGEIDEVGFPVPEDADSRVLASTYNFRTYGYYGLLPSGSFKSYMQNTLGPAVLAFFEGALRVKYPVNGQLKVSSSRVCSISTPSVLRSGVTADFFMMWDSKYDKPASAQSSTWVAESYSCYLASGTKRPLVGKTLLNSAVFVNPGSNVLLHEKNIYMILHETTHILGFSPSLYNYFLNSNGKRLSGHVKSGTVSGKKSKIIDVEPLTSRIRKFFGCSTMKGAYLENSGSSATAGAHFERRLFAFEAMTSGLIYQQSYSQFSLAMLEGSGWYSANYDMADAYWFGQGQGCSFLSSTCSSANSKFDDFCTGSSRGCTAQGRGGGFCQTDVRSDGCKFVHPSINYDCENTGAKSYARLATLQSFGRTAYSKCFEGTLSASSGASKTSFCFKYNCVGSGSNTKLQVDVGSKTLTCTEKGSMSVSGYKGYISCPDPLTFCSTVGAKVCPRGCMGRGSCNNGKCACYKGFAGKDCALNA